MEPSFEKILTELITEEIIQRSMVVIRRDHGSLDGMTSKEIHDKIGIDTINMVMLQEISKMEKELMESLDKVRSRFIRNVKLRTGILLHSERKQENIFPKMMRGRHAKKETR